MYEINGNNKKMPLIIIKRQSKEIYQMIQKCSKFENVDCSRWWHI